MTETVITVLIPTEIIEIVEAENVQEIAQVVNTVVEVVEIAERGLSGASAYGIAVAGGFVGTEAQWLESLQGEQGEPGADGTGDAYFEHPQLAASTLWTVVHNLNKKPRVTVEDSGDNIIEGDVNYLDNNSLTISFSAPFGGKAYLV